MRVLRLIFVGALAALLVLVAMANRQLVTLRAFPANFDAFLGGHWQVTAPLFLVIILAVLIGMILGLVWEWLREAQLRSDSDRRARDIAQFERETGGRRTDHDEVLTLLDSQPVAAAAPASTRTTLPARR